MFEKSDGSFPMKNGKGWYYDKKRKILLYDNTTIIHSNNKIII